MALPMLAVWTLFFVPPVSLQPFYGSWTAPEYPRAYLFISWSLGIVTLLAIAYFSAWDAQKCGDE